jgi:hypothetical protein
VEVTPQVELNFTPLAPLILMPATIPARTSPSKLPKKFPKGHNTRGASSPSPSQICSARISRMRRRRWRRWRTIPNCVNALLFEAEALKAAGKTDDAIRTLEKLAVQEIRTPGAMRGRRTGQALRREKRRRQSAAHSRGDPAKDCPADNIIEQRADG